MKSAHHPVHLWLGPVIWALWFVALYGGLSVACELAPPSPSLSSDIGGISWINVALGLLTLPVIALLLWQARSCWRAAASVSQPFIAQVAAGLYLLSAGATLAIALPLLFLPPCV